MYIPAASAHQPDTLKGLIYGALIRYYLQNSDTKDFIQTSLNFFRHLRNRGYAPAVLDTLFLAAGKHIDDKIMRNIPLIIRKCKEPSISELGDTLYMHWQYHPRGIQRHTLRKLYRALLEGHTGFQKLVVAVSRPPNLRDTLMSNNFISARTEPTI